jgi:hypothetical protein
MNHENGELTIKHGDHHREIYGDLTNQHVFVLLPSQKGMFYHPLAPFHLLSRGFYWHFPIRDSIPHRESIENHRNMFTLW